MEELLMKLEQLYGEKGNFYEDESECYFVESDLLNDIEGLCCEYLIATGGGCNWKNIGYLKAHGYDVFAGDKDSFGWLTGCVQRNNDRRIIVYG